MDRSAVSGLREEFEAMYQGPPQGPYGAPPPPPQQPGYYGPQYHQPPVVYVQQTMVKAPFNHTVHVVLDVLSCGVWVPIHLICWVLH